MNTFSIGKCYNFGKMIPGEFDGSWEDLTNEVQWIEFSDRRQLTDSQITYIKKGFMGLPMIDETPEGNLFPFGNHKGKHFDQVPQNYWDWIEKQEWLDKWPAVKAYSDQRKKQKKELTLSTEEISSILQKIQ